jgi:hypothetical protein
MAPRSRREDGKEADREWSSAAEGARWKAVAGYQNGKRGWRLDSRRYECLPGCRPGEGPRALRMRRRRERRSGRGREE